ncbi:MAG TPA: MotA/TolQ/ExbB proton channel family protein [Candidatus Krumholzibacteria bacterium]
MGVRRANPSGRRHRVVAALALAGVLAAAWLGPVWSQASTTPAVASADSDSVSVASAPASPPASAGGNGFLHRVSHSYLGQMYIKGGICMHPLLLCAILGLVLIIERAWTLWRARIDTRNLMLELVKALRQEGPRAALRVCEGTRGPIANMLHSGLLRAHRGPEAVEKAIHTAGSIEMAFLERGLLALATISNVAPLLGFLGTVTGMIRAFGAIAAAEQVSAKIVASGIEEALITTAAGLMIAVPVSAAYAYFVLAIDRYVLEMEEASAELVDELLDIEHRKATGQAPSPLVQP